MTTNWARNLTYQATNLLTPTTLEELQHLIKATNTPLKPLGSRHSFNPIADTEGTLLCLDHLNQILNLDPIAKTVTIQPAIRYGHLAQHLHAQGFALHNLASLPHISVAGAISTATHGSGSANSNLAAPVSALQLLTRDGQLHRLNRNHPDFPAAIISLGALGILTELTLDLVPTFQIQQFVYQDLPLTSLDHHLDDIMNSAYSVSLFTDWQNNRFTQLWQKRLASPDPPPQKFHGATLATEPLHPLPGGPAKNCTEQLGIPGPWHERLPHFRMNFTPSCGEELQSEYFIPRHHALPAIQAVFNLKNQITPLLHISEIRAIAPDTHWLSPCYHQPCIAFHFTWKNQNPTAVLNLLPIIESALTPYHPRPHWGKLFHMQNAHWPTLYPKWPAFQSLLSKYDPTAKLQNSFLQQLRMA